ncbi:MAG: VIT1/CCC1 transporter family protein [Dehalococcoidia bacterium]
MPNGHDANDIARWTANYRDEREGEALYLALADAAKDPRRADILRKMAAIEGRHAARWEEKLRAAGVEPPVGRPGMQIRAIRTLAGWFGVDAVLPLVRGMELRAAGAYSDQPDAADFVPEERGHARMLAAMTEGSAIVPPEPATTFTSEDATSAILGRERWHRRDRGGSLRAAVFGVNDGLVSNLSLVIGVAGANPEPRFILLAGVAGLLAGSFSMAAGEYVSMSAQREMFERQIALERQELAMDPEQEREELSLLYQAKGVPEREADLMARRLIADPTAALDTMAREELGLDPDALGSPFGAAASSLIAFAAGAVLPVLPYMVGSGTGAFVMSVVLSAIGIALVGSAITLFTGRSPVVGALRMVAIGAIAAGVTYVVGRLIGVGVAG